MAFASSMSVADYWNEFVLGNVEDWLRNELSVRHALNAAIAVHHTADYVAEHIGDKKYKGNLWKNSGSRFLSDFRLVADLLDTYKHCTLKDPARLRFVIKIDETGMAAGTSAPGTSPHGAGRRILSVQHERSGVPNFEEFRLLLDRSKLFWISPTYGEFMTHGITV